jgi:hypothetical protein
MKTSATSGTESAAKSRQIKEVLRQSCFFVRQRTMLRNRIPFNRMEGWGPDCHKWTGPAWPAPQRSVVPKRHRF